MSRKKSPPRKPYQRRQGSSNQFVALYYDLLDSDAWRSLTPMQQRLYVICCRESHNTKTTPEGGTFDERLFFMNKALRTTVHRLYPPSDTRRFKHDMAQLIATGFCDCVQSNYKSREPNLYRLSARWGAWGTDKFELPESVMTNYMKRCQSKGEPW